MKRSLAIIALLALSGSASQAQFSASFQTNTISGVISNWTGNYVVGGGSLSNDVLSLSGGATLNDSEALFEGNGFNSVSVMGSGTLWASSSILVVGVNSRSNVLTVSNGGVVNSANGTIGNGNGTNSVVVTGASSSWNIANTLIVGDNSSMNSLVISNGAIVDTVTFCYVGYSSGNNNSLQLYGSSVLNAGELFVGVGGGATSNYLIVSGSTVIDTIGFIGNGAGNNSVSIVNSGLWRNSGNVNIGDEASSNSLVIASGSTMSDVNAYIGFVPTFYSNVVLITDPGSIWSNSGSVYVGFNNTGDVLTVSNSATLYVSSQLNVYNGSTLTASGGNIIGGFQGVVSSYVNSGVTWLLNGSVFSANLFSNTGTVNVVGSSLYLNNNQNDVNVGVLNIQNGSLTLSNSVLINYGTIDAVYGNINLYNGSSLTNAGGTILTSNNVPVITSLSVTGADVQIAFHTGMGGSYGVEYTGDLTSGNWTSVQDGLTGTNGILTVVDTGGAIQTQRFYHALLHLP